MEILASFTFCSKTLLIPSLGSIAFNSRMRSIHFGSAKIARVNIPVPAPILSWRGSILSNKKFSEDKLCNIYWTWLLYRLPNIIKGKRLIRRSNSAIGMSACKRCDYRVALTDHIIRSFLFRIHSEQLDVRLSFCMLVGSEESMKLIQQQRYIDHDVRDSALYKIRPGCSLNDDIWWPVTRLRSEIFKCGFILRLYSTPPAMYRTTMIPMFYYASFLRNSSPDSPTRLIRIYVGNVLVFLPLSVIRHWAVMNPELETHPPSSKLVFQSLKQWIVTSMPAPLPPYAERLIVYSSTLKKLKRY